VPPGYWKDALNRKKYMDWLEKELGIEDKSQWYSISLQRFRASFRGLLFYYGGSLIKALNDIYPGKEVNHVSNNNTIQSILGLNGNFLKCHENSGTMKGM
jgi:hypothetical protein